MTTKWAHLPNAAHIDRILADIKARPEVWDAAWGPAYDAARGAVRAGPWGAAWNNAAWDAARAAAEDVAWTAARDAGGAAYDAILCLIAYDNSAHYLNCTPEHLETLAGLGIDEAILLRPAVIALNTK